MAIRVRRAASADRPAVIRLHVAIFSEIGQTRRAIERAILPGGGDAVWVAEESGGRIVGYAMADLRGGGAYFSWLGVAPRSRQRGVGARLIAAVHSWARAKGARTVMLDSRNRFKAALCAYLREGYEIVGTWQSSDGDTMIRLRRSL